jgi:hypothetical protein
MSPEELLEAENLPPELEWVATHYRLNPDDPVYLLIAWHWHRVKASEDTLQGAILELKTALDTRIEALADAADAIAGVNAALTEVRKEMANRPALLGQELQKQLQQPVTEAVAQLKAMEKSLGPAARSLRVVRHRELLAALLTGVALGALGTLVLFRA